MTNPAENGESTQQDLVQRARELCEKRVIEYKSTLSISSMTVAGYEWTVMQSNSWKTHLAEMDEHHVGTNEGENHCWRDLDEYPCNFLVTKAKRLLGGEE